jgi:hypothetical protein
MPLTSPDSLSARLDRLERESRRWKRVALGSWVTIAALFLLGQSPPRPGGPGRAVEADPFVFGTRGAGLALRSGGRPTAPRLALHDPAGRARATLAVGADGAPALTLLDTAGTTVRATLLVGPDGAPGFARFDPAGTPRLAVALFHGSPAGRPTSGAEPSPLVVTYDAAGVVRTTFGIRGSDAGLELADKGIARTVLKVQPDGTPDLLLRDGAGRGRAGLCVLPDGTPALNLNGTGGRPRAAMTLTARRGTRLALATGLGAVVWPAPP